MSSSNVTRELFDEAMPLMDPPHREAGFRVVFESSREALVVIDSGGIVYAATGPARDLLRLKEGNLGSSNLADFVSHPSREQLLKKLVYEVVAKAHGSLDCELRWGFTTRLNYRDALPGSKGRSGYFLLSFEKEAIASRAETGWRQVEAELRSVVESFDAGILIFDASGRVRFSNHRFAQIFGIARHRVARFKNRDEIEEALAPRLRNAASFNEPWRSFVHGRAVPRHDELELMPPPRRLLERLSRPVLDAARRPVGWLEVYREIHGDRQIQSRLLQTEKMAALGQLVSGIAHELNNPLTAIMGYGQLLLGHSTAPAQISEARNIYQEAERARRIVKNLLYFARENRPERMRVELNEIVERTLALRSYELKVENIAVDCELAKDLPQTMADPYQLQQVVLNLLVNAEQALLESRGQGRVWIRTSSSGGQIRLEISDDGPGIAPEIASRIFDPFFTTKPSGVGTGLGLSIVYGIVHQHGGEVACESNSGAGAKFIVDLPVVAVPETPRLQPITASQSRAVSAAKARILVVEDEPTVAQLIIDVLGEDGHSVQSVLDSQEGLRLVAGEYYDLVICDLRMPRLDGHAFYDALVTSGSPVQHRILFITGDTLAPRAVAFLDEHNLPYLAKPFLVEELKLAVYRLLEASQRNPRAANIATF